MTFRVVSLTQTPRVAELLPVLEKRTFELLACMERRQAESAKGCVDMTDTLYHWSHDFMVSYRGIVRPAKKTDTCVG